MILKQSSIKNDFIGRYFSFPFFKINMIGITFKSHKILGSIIIPNFINVMTRFFTQKIPTDIFFDYKPMLSNISFFITARMPWKMNHNISIFSIFSPFPISWFYSIFNFLFSDFAQFFSMLNRKRLSFSHFCRNNHFLLSFFRMPITFSRFNSFFNCFFRLSSANQPFGRIFSKAFLFCDKAHFSFCFFRMMLSFHRRGSTLKRFREFFYSFFRMVFSFYLRHMSLFKLTAIHYRRL